MVCCSILASCSGESELPGSTQGTGATASGPAGPGPGTTPSGPPPDGGAPGPRGAPMPGMSAAEDLTASWEEVLAAPVASSPAAADCPDADHDGFPDAWSCAGLSPERADCDDSKSDVTPATERFVAAGPFLMGSNSDHAGFDEKPVHVVTLSGYCLDVAERRRSDKLVEGITYGAAAELCASTGQSLPTEAQWEKAARGGCEFGSDPLACDAGDLRPYPWGSDAPSCTLANHQSSADGMPKMCVGAAEDAVRNTGPYGHQNMAGNVWEWVADFYHPHVYRRAPVRVDPTGPKSGDLHVLRGGGWNTFSTNMRVANRLSSNLEGSAVGVRCARSRGVGNADDVEPLRTVKVSGTVVGGDGALKGKALYVTAFDAADADPVSGMVAPGRSPVAETKMVPDGSAKMAFTLDVPRDTVVLVSAALDAGAPTMKGGKWMAESGSGGFGKCDQNPIDAKEAKADLTITVRAETIGDLPPSGPGMAPAMGGGGPGGGGPQGPAPGAPGGPPAGGGGQVP